MTNVPPSSCIASRILPEAAVQLGAICGAALWANALVLDAKLEEVRAAANAHRHPARFGVFDDIRQQLPHAARKNGFDLLGKRSGQPDQEIRSTDQHGVKESTKRKENRSVIGAQRQAGLSATSRPCHAPRAWLFGEAP